MGLRCCETASSFWIFLGLFGRALTSQLLKIFEVLLLLLFVRFYSQTAGLNLCHRQHHGNHLEHGRHLACRHLDRERRSIRDLQQFLQLQIQMRPMRLCPMPTPIPTYPLYPTCWCKPHLQPALRHTRDLRDPKDQQYHSHTMRINGFLHLFECHRLCKCHRCLQLLDDNHFEHYQERQSKLHDRFRQFSLRCNLRDSFLRSLCSLCSLCSLSVPRALWVLWALCIRGPHLLQPHFPLHSDSSHRITLNPFESREICISLPRRSHMNLKNLMIWNYILYILLYIIYTNIYVNRFLQACIEKLLQSFARFISIQTCLISAELWKSEFDPRQLGTPSMHSPPAWPDSTWNWDESTESAWEPWWSTGEI